MKAIVYIEKMYLAKNSKQKNLPIHFHRVLKVCLEEILFEKYFI